MKKIEFSEVALTGVRRAFPDPLQRESCRVSLAFYLQRDHNIHSLLCPAFDDPELYIYIYGLRWRVLYEVGDDHVLVWSFVPR